MDDPFARLGLPRRFRVEESAVRASQREALGRLHPDREQDPLRRDEALRASAAVSSSARQLLDPVQRAEWLLRAAGAPTAPQPDGATLARMLEWRERLAEAAASGEASIVAQERREVEEAFAETLEALAAAIDGPAAGPSDSRVADPVRAGRLLTELRMLRRLLESAGARP